MGREQPSAQRGQEPMQAQPSGLPILALLTATLAWGGSFTWAKAAGDGVNHAAGLPSDALLARPLRNNRPDLVVLYI